MGVKQMEIVINVIIFLVSAVACYLISALIHELGHVVCGVINKWKLFRLVVGPIKLYRDDLDSKLKIGIEKNIIMWCGAGGTLPRTKSEKNIKTWAKILLAGPLTSIIFGILMIPLVFLTHSIFALMLCLMPISMGMMCIIPMKMKTGLLYNDGTRYKRINSSGQEAEEEIALFRLIEISVFENDKVIYPQELVEPLLNSKDFSLLYLGYYYSYQNALKTNAPEMADAQRKQMELIKNKVPKAIIDDCPV